MIVQAARRKSSTWNRFNLKRQLSKVDMKLKSTFSTADNPKEKQSSVFYSDPFPNLELENLDDNTSPYSDEKTIVDSRRHAEAGDELAGDGELSPEEEGEEIHFGSLDISNARKNSFVLRPHILDLADDDVCPVPPPRHVKKKKQERRDQRLLSVPNIKFQKGEMQFYRDLRDKEDLIVSPQQSFSTNLMRRFSKS